MSTKLSGLCLVGCLLSLSCGAMLVSPLHAQAITSPSEEQLRRWLRQYPEADTDDDGTLTVREAEQYRQTLERRRNKKEESEASFEQEFTFATMSDGVEIALAIGFPRGFEAESARQWPTVFSLCGYPSSVTPLNPSTFGHRCVTVNASIRGTGASGGALNPWIERSWQDGYEIIENWIVEQTWSNGRVGIVGHSWPGLMGFLVATTNPPSLKAVCVSGLIEDAYRGICRPGGVSNCGFPVNWLNNCYGPNGPFDSGTAAQQIRGLDVEAYTAIVDSRPRRDLRDDMLWRLLHHPHYDEGWRRQSLAAHASKIRAPILMAQSYQDEQTGPSGAWIWKALPADVPKRLILSNGNHGITTASPGDMAAWLEHWLLEEGNGKIADPACRVQVYFETEQEGRRGPVSFGRPLETSDFPLPDTDWTPVYLRAENRLDVEQPTTSERPDVYHVGTGAIAGDGEQLVYAVKIEETLALCGPVNLTLWASLSTIDTDFFVLLADAAPDGTVYGLQRGLLRASHRAIDEDASVHIETESRQVRVRPIHSHASARPISPHQPVRFEIEIPVVGHVFRPGHTLVLRISRPPLGDPIGVTRSGEASYRYDSDPPTGTVQVLHDPEHPSHLLLPVLKEPPRDDRDAVPLSGQAGLQPVP